MKQELRDKIFKVLAFGCPEDIQALTEMAVEDIRNMEPMIDQAIDQAVLDERRLAVDMLKAFKRVFAAIEQGDLIINIPRLHHDPEFIADAHRVAQMLNEAKVTIENYERGSNGKKNEGSDRGSAKATGAG
jgi:hypothetical protein